MLTPTTKLEAVNIILSAIGESPVMSLIGSISADTSLAVSILDETSRFIQSQGWNFNTEKDFVLTPDENKNIRLPANCVYVDVDEAGSGGLDIVQRGGRAYDRTNRTYLFDSPIAVTLILLLEFEELPETARRYIMIRAARAFTDRAVGSDTLHGFTREEEMEALIAMKQFESDSADKNILTTLRQKYRWYR